MKVKDFFSFSFNIVQLSFIIVFLFLNFTLNTHSFQIFEFGFRFLRTGPYLFIYLFSLHRWRNLIGWVTKTGRIDWTSPIRKKVQRSRGKGLHEECPLEESEERTMTVRKRASSETTAAAAAQQPKSQETTTATSATTTDPPIAPPKSGTILKLSLLLIIPYAYLILFHYRVDADLKRSILINAGLSLAGFFVTRTMIPVASSYVIRRSLFGYDINKKGTPQGSVKV